jgi:hypothetical protein
MVLVTGCALAAWAWSVYRNRPEERLQQAMAALERDNPRAHLLYFRHENDVSVEVRPADHLSIDTARSVAKADMIRYLRLKAGNRDGLLGEIEMSTEARDVLEQAFDEAKVLFAFEVRCRRRDRATTPHQGGQFQVWP